MDQKAPNLEPTTEQKDAQLTWQTIAPVIEAEYRQFFLDKKLPVDPQTLETIIDQERQFFVSVLETVRRAAKRNQPIDLYFDIDGTIASTYSTEGDDAVRPSFILLLRQIHKEIGGDRVSLGFLTTRVPEDQAQKFQEDIGYGELRSLLHGVPIIHVRDKENIEHPRIDLERPEQVEEYLTLKDADEILDNFTPEELRRIFESQLTYADPEKIAKTAELRSRKPAHTIVVVDDLIYPEYLDESKGVFGVSLFGNRGSLQKFHLAAHQNIVNKPW